MGRDIFETGKQRVGLCLETDVPQERHDPRQAQVIMVQWFHPTRCGGKSGPAHDSAFAALKALECQHKIE